MNDFICPKCNQHGLPSIYLPMCTACANIERRKSGEIKDDNAAQHSVHLTALRRGLAVSWFIIIILLVVIAFLIGGR